MVANYFNAQKIPYYVGATSTNADKNVSVVKKTEVTPMVSGGASRNSVGLVDVELARLERWRQAAPTLFPAPIVSSAVIASGRPLKSHVQSLPQCCLYRRSIFLAR